jgi:hypothetical protein
MELMLISILMGSLGLWTVAVVHANPMVESTPRIVVSPSYRVDRTFYTNETFPGTNFVVNVTVVDVVDLQNWQIGMNWDPTVMEYVNIRLPHEDNIFTPSHRSLVTPPPDIGAGYVVWGATYINSPYWTFNGTGKLCEVEFRLLPTPDPLPITFNLTISPYDETLLLDGNAHDIPFTIEDGTFTLLPIPDIAVADIVPSKTIVGYNYTKSLAINVTILNQDYYLPNTFNFTIYGDEAFLGRTENVTLSTRGTITLVFTWNITGLLKGNHTITAITDPVPGETDLNDNVRNQTVVVTIPGDVTSTTPDVSDGIVDMRDIGIICNHFGTTPSGSGWNSNYDVNEDSVVNMRDIGIACYNFMKTDP